MQFYGFIYMYVIAVWVFFFPEMKAFVFPANAPETDVGNCALW